MTTTTLPRFASALSTHAQTAKAIDQVTEQLGADLAGATPDLLTIFVSHHHGGDIETLGPRLAKATGARIVLGCTGESVIGADREVEKGPGLSVWAACLPGTELRPLATTASAPTGTEGDAARPTFTALPQIVDPSRASVLLLADPFSFPMDEFLKRMNEQLPGVPAVGGMASGGMGPGQNLLFDASGLRPGGAIGVVLEGGIEVRSVVSQGCRPVGTPWVVTESEQNLMRKLGGKPALEVLMETLQGLGEEDRALFQRAPFVGLAIDPTKSQFQRGDFLVRGITGVSQEERAVAIGDLLRRGQTIQFLVRDAASASEDLAHLMHTQGGGPMGSAGDALDPSAAGALLFSCNGRGTRMFDQPHHDVTAVRSGLDADIPVAGFFAMGEVGPVGGRNFLHGFTASVAVFRPRTEGKPAGGAGSGAEHSA